MNAFASYADTAIPEAARRRQEKVAKPLSAFDLKMAEKQRLSRAYRVWRRAMVRDTLASEPRLAGFLRYLRTVGPEQAPELVSAIGDSWLPSSPAHVRIFALRMVDARCDAINRKLGFEALDDPLPPETSTYFAARAILLPGGRA